MFPRFPALVDNRYRRRYDGGMATAALAPVRWRKLKEWAPVVGGALALLALVVAIAILMGGALGRMEGRLRIDIREGLSNVRIQVATMELVLRGDVERLEDDFDEMSSFLHDLDKRISVREATE